MKYKILEDRSLEWKGRTLYRIQALKDFSNVPIGKIGGYVEYENNLSQEGDCWIYHAAKVYGQAWVGGKAEVWGNACVFGKVHVFGNAQVFRYAQVYDDAHVYDWARVYDYAQVYGQARVFGAARVYGAAQVYGKARVFGKAQLYVKARVYGESQISSTTLLSIGHYSSKRFHIKGTRNEVIISDEGLIIIGCETHTIEEWKKDYVEIGEANHYTEEEIKEYKLHIENMERYYNRFIVKNT